jgi:MYXO-CTERM domain-containing protein
VTRFVHRVDRRCSLDAGGLRYHALVLKPTYFCLLVLCAIPLFAGEAAAKQNGFPTDACSGCHKGGDSFKPRVTVEPAQVDPGQTVLLTIHVPAVNGPAAGLFFTSNNKGSFTEVAGGGMKKTANTQATHIMPKEADGNEVIFRIRWTAPTEPGGVEFDVTAVSANRNGNTSGDSEGSVRFNVSFGCAGEGVDAYLDQDGDGFGIPDLRGPSRFCELPPSYALKAGDCNDYDKRANPMGTETCNLYDDDCDGQINEGLDGVVVYRDEDGDGYGARFGEMKMGCGSGFGFSSTRDDCDDTDKAVHPGVKEMCNARDDDCNGRVDDGARAACGTGWCRRLAPTCDPASCMPGPPRAETCNAFDDDCDGVVDNGGSLCAEGRTCSNGFCLTSQEAAEQAAMQKQDGGTGGGGDAGVSAANPPPIAPPPIGGSSGGGTGGSSPSREIPAAPHPKLGCSLGPQGAGDASLSPLAAALALLGLVVARRRRRSRPDRD